MNIIAGDFRYFWPETLASLAHLPFAWDSFLNTGVGQPVLGTLWITTYLQLTSWAGYLGIPWVIIGLLFWQLPSIILSCVGFYLLARRLFHLPISFSVIAGLLSVANTYFLMLFLGGQAGVALAYSLIPWVLLCFYRVQIVPHLSRSVLLGLILTLMVLFDPRIVLLTSTALFLFYCFTFTKKQLLKDVLLLGIVPFLVVFSIHMFWIIPLVIFKSTGSIAAGGTVEGFRFLSFAGYDYALSWLHPNWPENIFGKISFLNPLFIIFPVFAFSSLFAVTRENKKYLLCFVTLAIAAAFFAKGAKEPFSSVNIFFFTHIPLMQLFRDSTKFYMLISIAYSLLIPYTLFHLSKYLSVKWPRYGSVLQKGVIIIFIAFVLGILSPIGTSGHRVFVTTPQTYYQLRDFLRNQPHFSRTLWLPQWQRFGYFSPLHPAVGRNELLSDTTVQGVKAFFARPNANEVMKNWSVQYVVVPEDSEKELFLTDRIYSDKRRLEYIQILDRVSWLKKLPPLGQIQLYEVMGYNDHFVLMKNTDGLDVTYYSPAKYRVTAKDGTIQGNLIFSESFDPNWAVLTRMSTIHSQERNGQNLFEIPTESKEVIVEYLPQRLVDLLFPLSTLVLIGWVVIVVVSNKKEKKRHV